MKARIGGKLLWMPNTVAAGADSFDPPRAYRVGLWKYIKRGWSFVSSHTRFDLGDGSKIRFWDDVWCGDTSLKVAFSILYNIANVKDATVATNMDLLSGTF